MWFEDVMGFKEGSPENVRTNILIEGDRMISRINKSSYQYGRLEIPSLSELKEQCNALSTYSSPATVTEVVGDIQKIHSDPSNANALFQAASQFNLLEMVGPGITPEKGVGRYELDYTQGPACAIACGVGTIYRNYFVPVNNQLGQTYNNQIDCLSEIGKALHNDKLKLWEMKNGYALANQEGLLAINAKLSSMSITDREALKEKLKVGIQWDTQVTIEASEHTVSQVYCSALPVAYSHLDFYYWEHFARLILEATYEATLYASLVNYEHTGCKKVYLTLVGGGAFGNEMDWIIESIEKAINQFKNTPLDIRIVSYGRSNKATADLVKKFE